jgi:thiopurine S-methyltransferase
MNPEFWHARWRDGQIAFHMPQPNPLLMKHGSVLRGTRVLVPLCGKTVDLVWLAAQGYGVVGVELCELAVRAFFDEQKLVAQESTLGPFKRFVSAGIELLCGDFFALEAGHVTCDAVYDRAALIALPEQMRKRYVAHLLGLLPARAPGLLITLETANDSSAGPPFSVPAAEVHALYEPARTVRELERTDVLDDEPRFRSRGISALHEVVYALS